MIKIVQLLDYLESKNIDYDFEGEPSTEIAGFSSLKNYKADTMTWAKNELAYQYELGDKLLLIAQSGLQVNARNVVYAQDSKLVFFSLIEYIAEQMGPEIDERPAVGKGTVIGKNVVLGKNVRIGINCVIDGNVSIGDDTTIWNNVTIINNVTVGKSCEIQSGCVIGHDGFAWNEAIDHKKSMIKHYGGVVIEDDVYMGPNCIIDRGEIDNTIIGKGTRMDADCFIAHNVIVGQNVVMITGCRLYGSSQLEDNAYLASAIVRNQCKVGENAFVGMGTVVTHDVPADVVVAGVPGKMIKKGK